jgi:hypothetical protein
MTGNITANFIKTEAKKKWRAAKNDLRKSGRIATLLGIFMVIDTCPSYKAQLSQDVKLSFYNLC